MFEFLCSRCLSKFLLIIVDEPNVDPFTFLPDGRFNHVQQVQERLKFLR